jgi:hypothetical protein
MTRRRYWEQFRDFVARTPPLGDPEFRDVIARIVAIDDAWLRRACIVTLVRGEREVCSDEQLRVIARRFGGKFAPFIEGVLGRRATSRARAQSAH